MSDSGGGGPDGPAGDVRGDLRALIAARPVVVCSGPGGVGKTTVSATLALQAARDGRRSCVVTVDPARRLADSLGIESLPNTPTLVPGDWPGELYAIMLDASGTFDDLVERYAQDEEQAATIRSNRLYQNLAGALSGTQEYMAMEKLYELTAAGTYDVVVVDTPPTRNALDLLDAPRRLTHFLQNRLFRALLLPSSHSYLRVVGVTSQALLRTIAKVAGAEIVQDAVTFFQAFQGMEDGFRARAEAVRALLAEPTTAYVLVTSPRADAVEETTYFTGKLAESGIAPAAMVVNRVHPRFVSEPDALGLPIDLPAGSDLGVLLENLRRLDGLADREEAAVTELVARVAPAPVGWVPLLGTDVHDLGGLGVVADALFLGRGDGDGGPVPDRDRVG